MDISNRSLSQPSGSTVVDKYIKHAALKVALSFFTTVIPLDQTFNQVVCGQCHSFPAHLFEALPELGPFDGMTMKREFCDELIAKCGTQIEFKGPADYDGLSFCDKHVGGVDGADELWSYPYTDRECTRPA